MERLDVLVNNAGVHLDMLSKWKQAHLSADGYEIQWRYSAGEHVDSYCLHPGGASGSVTNVADKGFEGSPIVGFLRKLGAPIERLIMATAEEGAQTQIYCATSPAATGGHYYVKCRIARAAPDTQDEVTAGRLWQETGEWLGKLQA